MREIPSFPFLQISREGKIQIKETGVFLNMHYNHSGSVSGPAVYVRQGKCTTIVSVARALYETYIKQAKMEKLETVAFIDFDEKNLSLDNLEKIMYRKKKTKKAITLHENQVDTWISPDAIYC